MTPTAQKGKLWLKKALPWAFSLCAALVFLLQSPLQPWGSGFPSRDSSVFIYIAQGVLQGEVPYTDMFDHKGPLLYLIQCLGLLLSGGSYWGIWLLQLANLTAAVFLWLKIAGQFIKTQLVQYLTVFSAVVTLVCFYDGGNFAEDHALVFISAAVYCFNRLLLTKRQAKREMLLYGACFAVVLLLKVNMVAFWVAAMPFAFFFLLYHTKGIKAPLQLLGLFCAGAAAVVLPVIGYTIATGCGADLWGCYIRFNMGYTAERGESIRLVAAAAHQFFFKAPLVWISVAGLLVCTVFCPKNVVLWANLATFAASLWGVSASGHWGVRYAMLLVPVVVSVASLVLAQLEPLLGDTIKRQRPLPRCAATLVVLVMLLQGAVPIFWQYAVPAVFAKEYQTQLVQFMQQNSQPDDDVLVLGNRVGLYLAADRRAQRRLFFQTPPINVDEALYDEFIASLKASPPDLAVYSKDDTPVQHEWDVFALLDTMAADGIYQYTETDAFRAWVRVSS